MTLWEFLNSSFWCGPPGLAAWGAIGYGSVRLVRGACLRMVHRSEGAVKGDNTQRPEPDVALPVNVVERLLRCVPDGEAETRESGAEAVKLPLRQVPRADVPDDVVRQQDRTHEEWRWS